MPSGTAKYRYETNKGNIFYCRTDDAAELDPIRGAEPNGNVTEAITFKFSKNVKEVGCIPRHAILALKSNVASNGCLINPNSVLKRVIILKKDHSLPVRNSTIKVNGRDYLVRGYVEEQMR